MRCFGQAIPESWTQALEERLVTRDDILVNGSPYNRHFKNHVIILRVEPDSEDEWDHEVRTPIDEDENPEVRTPIDEDEDHAPNDNEYYAGMGYPPM